MSKILRFMNNGQDYNEDEMLQLQKSALQSYENTDREPKPEGYDVSAPELSVRKHEDTEGDADGGKASFIGKNVIITGSISSVTTIEIEGQINGNVTCKNDVYVSGTVAGDISASYVRVSAGHVKGDINCKNAVVIDKDSAVKGNITGESIECDGKVEGNTRVKDKALIMSSAVIHGDIFASRISMEEGVEIKGVLKVCRNNSIDGTDPDDQPQKENAGVKTLNIDGQKYI